MFMQMAALVAQRSTCPRAQVGALIVLDRRPISMGYNGAPPYQLHCTQVGCEEPIEASPDGTRYPGTGCQRAVHAELNAIAWAARHGVKTAGATIYCTHAPCRTCAQAILSAGIVRLVYEHDYRASAIDILEGLEIVKG
jgi:dCMP deaminase